jgi:hypothetical protein
MIRIMNTLYEDKYTFFVIFRSVFLRMEMFQAEYCTENQNTRFIFNNSLFFPPEIVPLWDVEKYCRAKQATDESITRRMRIACLLP